MNFIKLCLQTTLITEHGICLMFASYVSDSRFPFKSDESFKTLDNGLCTAVQMLANYTFQPVIKNFATLFLHALIYIPEVIVVIYLPILLCRLVVTNYDKMTSGI